jgi:hypothetical protein
LNNGEVVQENWEVMLLNRCHIRKFWNVKINKIGTMYVVLIEISQGIKTFCFIQKPY